MNDTPRYCEVIVDIASESVDRVFTYAVPAGMDLSIGQRVAAPFGPRTLEGFVVRLKDEAEMDEKKVRPIARTLEDYPLILPELMELAKWIKLRYKVCLAEALRLMIPAQLRKDRVREKRVRVAELTIDAERIDDELEKRRRSPRQVEVIRALMEGPKPVPELSDQIKGATAAVKALFDQGILRVTERAVYRSPYALRARGQVTGPALTGAQQRAVDALTQSIDRGGGRYLLLGVTGSGKTEVYIQLVLQLLKRGKTAIVLVPEIALTPQMVDWFCARFGQNAAVLHSRLSAGERYDEWRRIRMGEARVVIGARSAVFAPLSDLGAIVVDEEHEHTYQSEHRPRYDAREVAIERCRLSGAVLVLGSATPSISTFMKTRPGVRPENRLELLELSERVMGRAMPEVQVVDMSQEIAKGNYSIFSASLQLELRECLDQGHQAILFINRRGHSTFVSCRACGYVERCEDCDVTMTYHRGEAAPRGAPSMRGQPVTARSEDLLKCHYCGAQRKPKTTCPACGSAYIRYFGVGTQKIEEEMGRLFPEARIARMDRDTTAKKDAHERILHEFRSGRAQILIGTQMIAKGLDFPNVTLVGVVAADVALNFPDYRSTERTFQLITQVAGRAGRAEHPGKVVVQTYEPEHYGIELAAKQDYRAFYQMEARFRKRGLYPPYTVIARIVCTAKEEQQAQAAAEAIEVKFNAYLDESGHREDVVQMRALEAPLKRIRGEARWQVFIKLYARGDVDAVVEYMEKLRSEPVDGVTLELEVNPVSML